MLNVLVLGSGVINPRQCWTLWYWVYGLICDSEVHILNILFKFWYILHQFLQPVLYIIDILHHWDHIGEGTDFICLPKSVLYAFSTLVTLVLETFWMGLINVWAHEYKKPKPNHHIQKSFSLFLYFLTFIYVSTFFSICAFILECNPFSIFFFKSIITYLRIKFRKR